MSHSLIPARRRTRVLAATLLAGGALIAGQGTAMAAEGPTGHGSAAIAQYGGTPTQANSPQPAPAPAETVLASDERPATVSTTTASPSGSLPFTGADVVPVLAAGLVLLALGALLRRRTASV